MASIYELTGIFKQIAEMEGIDEETKLDTLESIDWTEQFEEKVENTVKVIKNKEADVDQLKEEIDRLTKRKKSIENDITRLKTGLQGAFEITGHEKVKTLLFTVSLANNQPSVVVDEDLLPKKYFVQTLKPDKTAIKELLKAGKKVKGAVLQESRSLRIR
ncbi:TPA: siphovirus Gp157 family protein [Streptococcus suis]|uniref:siphovirus Gp157 family protein n=1 Tax=Streptococcus suis TaxID=1307 RepID=UPI0009444969|nr:siphovirus Gp157 family protein [Streptococcus suis]RRN54659.1 siphovirus Gp157 family protein [Streptococcus suis]HEL1563755.1 siphovirus Gp157 family protein [Streptococcus suis]HEL1698455.1 siphovirus Gp157 family protein [Streptococcus suis]HEL1763091.1 siphovirus Gp157 family protein [Streptococcus suis]HEL1792995.1 siphovirus Gp157 family protein [Streptococcus suis]